MNNKGHIAVYTEGRHRLSQACSKDSNDQMYRLLSMHKSCVVEFNWCLILSSRLGSPAPTMTSSLHLIKNWFKCNFQHWVSGPHGSIVRCWAEVSTGKYVQYSSHKFCLGVCDHFCLLSKGMMSEVKLTRWCTEEQPSWLCWKAELQGPVLYKLRWLCSFSRCVSNDDISHFQQRLDGLHRQGILEAMSFLTMHVRTTTRMAQMHDSNLLNNLVLLVWIQRSRRLSDEIHLSVLLLWRCLVNLASERQQSWNVLLNATHLTESHALCQKMVAQDSYQLLWFRFSGCSNKQL